MKSVLIIDSDPVFGQLNAQILEPLGLDVAVEESGAAGEAKAEKFDPDLIVLSAELSDITAGRLAEPLAEPLTASRE